MKQKQKKIQVFLLVIGFLLILFTYFYYPYMMRNKSLVEKNIPEDLLSTSDEEGKDATSFENIEYKGLYDLDKTFIVKSEKANIDSDDPDIVYMTNMHVILYLKDGRIVNILSNKGKYNKANYDCFFESNVKATDGETIILAENLDLLATEDYASIYNNVSLASKNGSLKADKVDYDFETKYYQISMFNEEKIKIKLFQ